MKTLLRFLFLMCVFVFSSNVLGQVSNLLVNGSSTNFTMASGSEISWSYDLPVGGTAILEIWIDANSNTIIDSETDVLWQSFYQIDGQSSQNGPPDMDGLVNGHIMFAQPVGLAPGNYVMSFSNNNSLITIPGTVTPLASPVFTISGNVTVPAGKSAQFLVLSINSNDENGGGKFWDAITDASGNFSIQMDADTSGNPWKLGVDNLYRLSPAVLIPDRITLVLDAGVKTAYTGNNFTFYAASAEVNGTVKDEDGNPISGADVYLSRSDQGFQRNTQSDVSGFFSIGLLNSELPLSDAGLGSGNSEDENIFAAGVQIPSIISGNVITKSLVIYKSNSTISGKVMFMGVSPNMNVGMLAYIEGVGMTRTYSDFSGNYTLHVTDKLANYQVGPDYLPYPYAPYTASAQPGQNNVDFNFNPTDVEQDGTGLPTEFALQQNYPNPFNPSTIIRFNVKESGSVQLKVFNVLGNEVATLLNEYKSAGRYAIQFDASQLTSGVYFYKLQVYPANSGASAFAETRKMLLLK